VGSGFVHPGDRELASPALQLARTLRVRWLIVLVPAAIYFFSYFHRIAPAVVAGDLMRTFSIAATSLGNLAAVYPYVFVLMALPAGGLADTLGPRWTLALGAATMGVGAVVFGVAPVFGVAFLGRLLVGLGASVILIASLRLAADWFRPEEFGTISGWSQTVGNVGGLVASSPLALLVEALGWRQSFVLIGTATLLLGLAALLFVRDRPEDMGLVPVNPGRAAQALPSIGETVKSIPPVLANPRTWPPVLAATGAYSTLIAFFGLWGIPYLTQVYGLPRVQAANYASLLAIGIVVGAPLVGWLSDRWLGRRRLPFVAFTAVYAACWALLALPGEMRLPVTLLPPFFFLMGFASCGLVLVWACVREVNDPARVGIAIGFCNMPVFLGFALLQWLTGAILDARWEGLIVGGTRFYPASAWEAAFALCLAVSLGALLLTFFVTETRCRNVWRRREA
jgi:sugar phosphate permease